MPNVAQALKAEITRLARKETKAAVSPIRNQSVRLRKDVANLKKRMALLEQETKAIQALLKTMKAAQPTPIAPAAEKKVWFTGKGIKSLRKRLGLTQTEFARLVGVTKQAVVKWQQKPGMLTLRDSTKAALLAIRDIGAREAKRRLEEMNTPQKAKKVVSKRGKARQS